MLVVPQAGDRVGRYRLIEELGRGGMAVVFRAEDPSLGREVAIKIMHAHLWGAEASAARFAREARAVAALRHPNIVEIHDFSEGGEGEQGVPGYIVSELVRGPTLQQFVATHGRPLPAVAALIGLKLASALSCAHARGIIHRDLKPENVMIAEGGRVVLADFGIARVTEGASVTETGALVGSPAYMSPEQARGLRVDPRSDLFSLGVMLYQLCTGALPFPGKDPISTVLRVLSGKYDPPLKLNPQISGRLDRLLRSLLEIEPEQRPASAEALCDALREVLAESDILDADAELTAYFAAPGEYNQRLVQRIVGAALAQAEQAGARNDATTVLRLCDRVLAFVPDQPQALALMRRQQSRRRRWPLLLGVVTLAGAGLSVGLLHSRRQPSPVVAPAPMAAADARTVAPRLDAAPAPPDGPTPDRSPPDQGRRRRGRPPRPVAALRPDAGVPTLRSDARVPTLRSDATRVVVRPPAGPAELSVKLGPFCDLSVDGRPAGRSPLAEPLKLEAGTHVVVCVHAPSGAVFRKEVRLVAGERRELSGPVVQHRVRVRLELTRGDAVRIGGESGRGNAVLSLTPGHLRVELLRGGALLQAGYVSFWRDCALVDEPRLECR